MRMSDLIDRQALKNKLKRWDGNDPYEFVKIAFWAVDNAPTIDAAAAIEELQAEAKKTITLEQAIDRLRELGWLQEHDRILTEPINDLQARLEEAENSVENYKRMWLEKHEPKTARWEGWTSTHWSKRCDSNGDPIYTEHTYYQCSYCGRRTVVRENICPNCGAVMEDMCEVQK